MQITEEFAIDAACDLAHVRGKTRVYLDFVVFAVSRVAEVYVQTEVVDEMPDGEDEEGKSEQVWEGKEESESDNRHRSRERPNQSHGTCRGDRGYGG